MFQSNPIGPAFFLIQAIVKITEVTMIVAGCDVGSLTAKALILKDGSFLAASIIPDKSRPEESAVAVIAEALSLANLSMDDIDYIMGTMGCRNTWGMVKPFAREMEKAGLPTLISYSDSFDSRIESADTMLDKLMEFLKVRGLFTN
jgi:hypothetical protein